MSDDKKRFSARVRSDTLDTIDDYADDRGLNRSQAIETITDQWGELTEDGSVHPSLVKARNETTNNLLADVRSDKLAYLIAALVAYLVYDYVALPSLAVPVMLFLAVSWAAAGTVGYFVAAADRIGLTATSADEIEVEA